MSNPLKAAASIWHRGKRYLFAPAYVLGLMASILGPLYWQPYTGPAPEWWAKQKPVAKADKAQDRLVKITRKENK